MSHTDNLVEELYLGDFPERTVDALERIANALDKKQDRTELNKALKDNVELKTRICKVEIERDILKKQLEEARDLYESLKAYCPLCDKSHDARGRVIVCDPCEEAEYE